MPETPTTRIQFDTFVFDPESDTVVPDLIERSSGPNWPLLGGLLLIIGGLAFLFAPGRGKRSVVD